MWTRVISTGVIGLIERETLMIQREKLRDVVKNQNSNGIERPFINLRFLIATRFISTDFMLAHNLQTLMSRANGCTVAESDFVCDPSNSVECWWFSVYETVDRNHQRKIAPFRPARLPVTVRVSISRYGTRLMGMYHVLRKVAGHAMVTYNT